MQYEEFARVYDTFMDNVPYEKWGADIVSILRSEGIEGGLVAELGCGTGTMTKQLSDAGYEMIGIDISPDMLSVAREKYIDDKILWLCQDMREFELYGTVGAIVSVCDSVNYITEPEELVEVFRLVNNYLDKDGLFIFDFNTVHKYRDEIGDTIIAENREDCSFIWENEYDDDNGINTYYLTLFIMNEEGLFERSIEEHSQRGYELAHMKEMLSRAGMVFVSAYDTDTHEAVNVNTQRVTVVAREGFNPQKLYI